MTTRMSDTAERYASGLKRYIASQSEEMLVQSFAIGRTGIEGHFHLVDIAMTHHEVVEEMLARATSTSERAQIIEASRDFLLECLGPFEMAMRGFRDSNAALQMLNRELEDRVARRTANLAEANALLQQEIGHRRQSEAALAQNSERLRVLRRIDQAIVAAHSSTELAEVVLEQLRQIVPCERCSITEVDPLKQEVVLLNVWSASSTRLRAGQRFDTATLVANDPDYLQGQIRLTPDLEALGDQRTASQDLLLSEGIRTHLTVPLTVRGALIGSLDLGRTRRRVFTNSEIEVVKEIAAQLALGLENIRLLEMERRRNSELAALHDASLKITARLELQPVLQTISEYALTSVNADDAQIFLYDGAALTFGARCLRLEAEREIQPPPLPDDVTQTVARTGERISISNVSEHAMYSGQDRGGGVIGIPLVVGGEVHGVMSLMFDQPHEFTEGEVRFLDLLCDQAAIALHNAQLYQQLHRYTDELEHHVAERTQQLDAINRRISAIFNSSSDAISVCDFRGVILQSNPAFQQLSGLDLASDDGVTLFTALQLTDPDALAEALRRVVENEQPVRMDLTLANGRNELLDFDATFAPLVGEDMYQTQIMCSLHDITQRKQLEEDLRNALGREREIRDLKSRFTSMVSHEFRTPLAVIQSSSDLLTRYAQRLSDERKAEQLFEIQHQVRNLTALLDDVLSISRAENVGLEFTPVSLDLSQLCRDIIAEIQTTTAKHELHLTSDDRCRAVWGDAKLLQQAVRNLLTNAVKYSPAGGPVAVDLRCDDASVILRVADKGIGIPEDDMKYLFEAFHRAKNVGAISGTGLGLSIVSQAIELHGGKVEVESSVGVGTTFTLRFPRSAN